MMIYPIIICLFALLAIFYLASTRYFKKSLAFYIFWFLAWLFIIIFAFVPELSMPIANLFGISRGLDFLLIVAVIIMLYLVFRMYIKMDKLQEELTEIVTKIALENEIVANKDDEDKKN